LNIYNYIISWLVILAQYSRQRTPVITFILPNVCDKMIIVEWLFKCIFELDDSVLVNNLDDIIKASADSWFYQKI
jgi:hypothetical protein